MKSWESSFMAKDVMNRVLMNRKFAVLSCWISSFTVGDDTLPTTTRS